MPSNLLILSLLGFVYLPLTVLSYGQTLADCKSVASLFRNTCSGAPSTAADWNSFTGSSVSCSGMASCPTGGTGTAPNCQWTRKLCVTCTETSSKVYMRVQTNSLFDHCYNVAQTVNSVNYDVTFRFNPTTSGVALRTFSS